MKDEQRVIENLEIFLSFVQSDEYEHMVKLAREDKIIKQFITNIHLRYDTITFFQDIDELHPRVFEESNVLAQLICDFLDYQ